MPSGGARPNTGGARPGAGRKSRAEEEQTAEQARKAIIAKYGSIEGGLEFLLVSKEPQLIKWVFEHALGKPPERVQLDGELNGEWTITLKLDANNKLHPTVGAGIPEKDN